MRIRNTLLSLLLFANIFTAINAIAADVRLLGAGDVVRITVYGLPDMTTVTRISENNRISFPLIGDVAIGGLTATEAEAKIASELSRRGFVKKAQVNLFVEQRFQTLNDTVTVLGQVAKPGNYVLHGSTVEGVQNLIDLIAAAGGTNEMAGDRVILVRNNGKNREKTTYDLYDILGEGAANASDYNLRGGDVVYIPEMDVFYIYGQVQKPGRYRLERGMRIMQALPVGGGISDRGSEKGIQIKRNIDGNIKTLDVDPTDEVLKDDVIYVKERLF